MSKIPLRKIVWALALIGLAKDSFAIEISQPALNYFNDLDQPTINLSSTTVPDATPPQFSNRAVSSLSANTYAETLGWVPTAGNLCGGYYQEPAIVLKYSNPQNATEETSVITAELPSLFSQKATSILRGNVTVTQKGRQVTADTAYLNRDPVTGKINTIDLYGNVHLREAGKLIVAQQAHLDLTKNTAVVQKGVYRISRSPQQNVLNAWGTVVYGVREGDEIMNFNEGSYSTCPPTSNSWRVHAKKLHLDKAKGEGTAINSWLAVHGIPLFYLPYFTFPIGDARKTGFLFPTYSYSQTSGFEISVPYYLNLAPNYDMTLTPNILSKRGWQQNTDFRYLTSTNTGTINWSILPQDQEFKNFKQQAPAEFAAVPNEDVYLKQLNNSPDTRNFLSYVDNGTYNVNWSSSVNLNYVTDDYYFEDFGSTPGQIETDQLLNETDLNYQSENWRFLGRLQGYETLHPINSAPVDDQYSRLPEFDLNGDYPGEPGGLDYQIQNQFVNFSEVNDFLTGEPVVDGQRYHVVPGISLPLESMSGYFTPQLQLDATEYSLKNQVMGEPSNLSRALPVFDIDSGLFFDRDFKFRQQDYRQTLEPRLFYLLVPATNQSDFPDFDTALPPFSFEQMFQTNRFSGYDLLGDANQVTLALTSRFLNNDTGQQKLSASIGSIYLFQQHRVICNDVTCLPDPTENENISPVVGEVNYTLNPVWNVLSDLAWDPNRTRTDNGSFNLIYNNDKRVVNFGYYFVRQADTTTQLEDINGVENPITSETNLSRVNVGAAWPLTQHWSGLVDWNYNLSAGHPQVYFYGAQYDSCCWTARFIVSHSLVGYDQFSQPQFDREFYVQLQLKGLGNFGNNDPSALIGSALPGYQDQFQGGFRPMT